MKIYLRYIKGIKTARQILFYEKPVKFPFFFLHSTCIPKYFYDTESQQNNGKSNVPSKKPKLKLKFIKKLFLLNLLWILLVFLLALSIWKPSITIYINTHILVSSVFILKINCDKFREHTELDIEVDVIESRLEQHWHFSRGKKHELIDKNMKLTTSFIIFPLGKENRTRFL